MWIWLFVSFLACIRHLDYHDRKISSSCIAYVTNLRIFQIDFQKFEWIPSTSENMFHRVNRMVSSCGSLNNRDY